MCVCLCLSVSVSVSGSACAWVSLPLFLCLSVLTAISHGLARIVRAQVDSMWNASQGGGTGSVELGKNGLQVGPRVSLTSPRFLLSRDTAAPPAHPPLHAPLGSAAAPRCRELQPATKTCPCSSATAGACDSGGLDRALGTEPAAEKRATFRSHARDGVPAAASVVPFRQQCCVQWNYCSVSLLKILRAT